MILGFKTGPKNFEEGQKVVTDIGASMCEIWFDVTKADTYKEMFSWLTKHNVAIGLHHWGVIDGNIKTNLSTQNEHIRTQTIDQIKQTIDIGADIGCVYVNAHPGAEAIETMDFTDWKQAALLDNRTPPDIAEKLFLEAGWELTEYANTKGVLLTIESITARESSINHDRFDIYDPGNAPLSTLREFTQQGGWFANDISHTGSRFLVEDENTQSAWNRVLEFSASMAPRTRLVHMNVITPPYNGTDSHDGITDKDFQQETFPDKQGVRDFLSLFKNRDDVFVVNEPKGDPAGNYVALRTILENIG